MGNTGFAGQASLSWTAPTENTDGTPLTNLASYRLFWRCATATSSVVVTGSATAHVLDELPDGETCFFSLEAVNSLGVASVRSNEASVVIAAGSVADPTSGPLITWAESSPVVMPSRTGTASQANASGGNGSTSVTVPVGANGAVAFITHWDDSGAGTLSGLTLGGNAFTARSQKAVSGDASGAAVFTLTNLPAAGSQTLAWTYSAGAAREGGGKITVVWIADINTADPFRDADTAQNTETTATSVTIDSNSTDLVLAYASRFNDSTNGGPNFVLDGTVFIADTVLNSAVYEASEVTAGASSTTVNMTNEYYSAMAAISLKAAAVGGASILPLVARGLSGMGDTGMVR